jgi:hypothetical protein
MSSAPQNHIDEEKNISIEKKIEIGNHETIASHLKNALKYYRDAAKYHEEGNNEKAHKSSIYALGHCSIARELLRENARNNKLKGFT